MSRFRRNLPLQSATLAFAQDYIGQGEVGGNNRGPMVEFFLDLTGFGPGAAWCAAFVYACSRQACALKNIYTPLREIEHPALVQSYVDWAREQDRLVSSPSRIGVGDIFALNTGNTSREYDHMGLVTHRQVPDGHFPTCEGNTSPGESAGSAADRDGDLVASKVRSFSKLNPVFIRWAR